MSTPQRSAARRVRTTAPANASADEYDRAQARLRGRPTAAQTPTAVAIIDFMRRIDHQQREILMRLDAINSRMRNIEAMWDNGDPSPTDDSAAAQEEAATDQAAATPEDNEADQAASTSSETDPAAN